MWRVRKIQRNKELMEKIEEAIWARVGASSKMK